MWRGLLAVAAATAIWSATLTSHERITTAVTWDREISAIFRARCVTCHRDGGAAPMPLTTYAQARPWARAIRHEVLTRRMPLWRAARGYGDFVNDPSLTPFEIALVVSWVDGGAPRTFLPRGSIAVRVAGPAEDPLNPDAPVTAPFPGAREIQLPCADVRAPTGDIVGLRPRMPEGGSLHISAVHAGGDRSVLAWLRGVDPKDEQSYWLRAPLPTGSGTWLRIETSAKNCRLGVLTVRPAAMSPRAASAR